MSPFFNFFKFPKIHVYLDPHQFTFESPKNEVLTLKTVLYIAQEKGSWTVVGIDHWENGPTEVLAVNLFENDISLPNELNKMSLLSFLLEYGIAKCVSSTIIPSMRPIIILHGINNFSEILGGYEKAVFGMAALSTVARKVVLDTGITIAEQNDNFNNPLVFS
jgi:hypothetical protein